MWAILELTRQMGNNWFKFFNIVQKPIVPIYGLYFSSQNGVTIKTSFQNENKCQKVLLKGDWK